MTNNNNYIDITPDPHVLTAMAAQNLPWWKVLAELIDNSFDAKATRVSIRVAGRKVIVVDDGVGIPDVAVAVTMGGHREHGGRSLGRYGIGLKDAWRGVGERIEIVTTRGGQRQHLDFSVSAIQLDGRNWRLPKPLCTAAREKSGTSISLHLREGKNKPGADCWESLAWAFQPALLSGRQIVYGTDRTVQPLSPCRFPVLAESIQQEFDIRGKAVRIQIGLLAPGENMPHSPFWVQHQHRNITHVCLGVKEFSDTHLGGIIELGDGWTLTRNKDDFHEHEGELEDAIHQHIRPLLIKAEQLHQDRECAALTSEITGILNSAIPGPRRKKRASTGVATGTVAPAHTESKRTTAADIHVDKPGSVVDCDGARRKTGVTISWYSDASDPSAGTYEYFGNRIRFNLANELVLRLRAERNSLALTAVAAAILAAHHCRNEGQTRLLIDKHEFGLVFGELTRTMRVATL